MDYIEYSENPDSELRSKIGHSMSTISKFSNSENLLTGEFGCSAVVAKSLPRTALGNHVNMVIPLATKEEMFWVNAGRIVASVKHTYSGGYRPKATLPHSPV